MNKGRETKESFEERKAEDVKVTHEELPEAQNLNKSYEKQFDNVHDKSFENAKPVEESKGIDEDLLNSVLQRLEKAEVHIPSLNTC
jgi:hypothetical protein